jgi:hypothetical protein
MTEATEFIRSASRQRLTELIGAALPGDMECLRNEPREWADDQVWLADTIGNVDYPASAGNVPRDDAFTVVVVCQSAGDGETAASAEAKVESYASAVMAAVTVNPIGYSPLGGLVGVLAVTVSAVDGPDVVPSGEGYEAVMTVAVEIQTRIVRPT